MSAGSPRARLAMIGPVAKVLLRRVRNRQRPGPDRSQHAVAGRDVDLPVGHAGQVEVDGRDVGHADVRHDHGSSTLEAWTRLTDETAAAPVAAALVALARELGAHRLAWSLRPGSAEQVAATAAGLVREGRVTPPLASAGVPHELWAIVSP